jgi:hypothetical protein
MLTLVAKPLGDVKVNVTTPAVAGLVNPTVKVAKLTSVVLGTGEPPASVAVVLGVAETEMVVPAAIGLRRIPFASATMIENAVLLPVTLKRAEPPTV